MYVWQFLYFSHQVFFLITYEYEFWINGMAATAVSNDNQMIELYLFLKYWIFILRTPCATLRFWCVHFKSLAN